MDTGTRATAAWFGVAFGLAVLCKFSCIGYVPAACLALFLHRVWREPEARSLGRAIPAALLVAIGTTVATIYAGYGFHPQPFLGGIRKLADVAKAGHTSFLLGQVSAEGWWYYFPVAVALKTTIASLLLALGAIAVRRTRSAEALFVAAAILAVAMTSTLDLGVRYVLPLYAPLSVAAAGCALALLDSGKLWLRSLALALIVWHGVTSLAARSDAFP